MAGILTGLYCSCLDLEEPAAKSFMSLLNTLFLCCNKDIQIYINFTMQGLLLGLTQSRMPNEVKSLQ